MEWRGLKKYLGEVYPNVSFSTLHKATATREGKGAKG
jgi:hypothetical protein